MSFLGISTRFLNPAAVKFNPVPEPVPCTTNPVFCQPTEQTDQIAFQFLASESTELVTNGNFDSALGVGWTFPGWTKGISLGNSFGQQTAAVNALSQKGILTVNDFYRVTLTVSNFAGGQILVGGGSGSALNDIVLTIQSNGTFTGFFTYTEAGGDGDFIIQGNGSASINTRVDDVSVINISDPSDYVIQIINQETGTVIDTVPAANIQIIENVITVDFNWTDDVTVTNGCRQIQIIDNTNLLEDDFNINIGWTVPADITFPGTEMLFTSTGITRIAVIAEFLTPGVTYEFTLITTSIAGGGSVRIVAGSRNGTTRTTNGTFVEELTASGNGQLLLLFKGAAAATVGIDNLTVKQVDNIAGRTPCYDLQTTHDCTLIFVWSNNESWGGFNYNVNSATATGIFPTFVHRLRLESKFRGTKYPSTRIIGEDSAGVKAVDYTSLRKIKILDIHRAPDYIHDAVASFFMQDNRTIEDISYIMEDEYEPSAPNDSRVLFKDFMTSRSELEETEQPNLINRNV